MRRMIAAAVGVLGLAASASAQYPSTAPNGPNLALVGGSLHHPASGGYFMSRAAFGDPYVNNAAGSIWSDHSFMFGSSRAFFAPCGPYIPGPKPHPLLDRLCGKGDKNAANKSKCENGSLPNQ